VNGLKARKKETECGLESMVTTISASGRIRKLMAMECIPGLMETNTKVSGLIV
jgi:hypothetical protein